MRTSLIVTTYNWPQALARCLASIASQRRMPDEVIVADDGSTQETTECIRAFAASFPVPLHHAWQEDRGFRLARVRNLGIERSTGDYLIFLDGDMVLHRDFVADHATFATRGTWLQGGRLNSSPAEAQRLLAGGRARFAPWMDFDAHLAGELKREHALRLPWLARRRSRRSYGGAVMGCNMGVWREDIERINGFDEAFEGWGHEDIDMALRLAHAGVGRRALRFAGLAVHIWHRTRRPDANAGLQPNDLLVQYTRDTRRIRCERGLDGHRLPVAAEAEAA